jgi:hypothetical protein
MSEVNLKEIKIIRNHQTLNPNQHRKSNHGKILQRVERLHIITYAY